MESVKKSSLVNGFMSYSSKINWIVFWLIVVFSYGSWIVIFGVWSQLPLMVLALPEGWRLPSILTFITQMAQIASMTFVIGRHFFPEQVTFVKMIYLKFLFSTISCFLLSFFWKSSTMIFNESRSIGLFILHFIISLFDGTSSITFLPFLTQRFDKEYIIPYYIGETMFALFPAAIAIFQGVGDDLGCRNETSLTRRDINQTHFIYENLTSLKQIETQPLFSVFVYYNIIFILVIFSIVSFILINHLSVCKKAQRKLVGSSETLKEMEVKKSLLEKREEKKREEKKLIADKRELIILYAINFLNTFVFYGILPGLFSYSSLPYGNNTFHLSINLSNLLLPIAIFLSVWSYKVSVRQIVFEFLFSMIFAIYLGFLALKSPCPPFLDSWLGPFLTILSSILSQSLFMRVRCVITARLERFGENVIMWSGFFTVLGEVVGGIISYILIEQLRLLTEMPECETDKSFCYK